MVSILTAGDKHFFKWIEHVKKETGINFGFGLPLAGFSNTNVGFEYASRGTDGNTYKEDFWSFRIGFSLNDKWFMKRKFN